MYKKILAIVILAFSFNAYAQSDNFSPVSDSANLSFENKDKAPAVKLEKCDDSKVSSKKIKGKNKSK